MLPKCFHEFILISVSQVCKIKGVSQNITVIKRIPQRPMTTGKHTEVKVTQDVTVRHFSEMQFDLERNDERIKSKYEKLNE